METGAAAQPTLHPSWLKAPSSRRPVLVAVLICLVLILIIGLYWRRRTCPACEGFYWTEWLGGTERENYDQRRRRRSRFESFGAYGMPDPFGGFPDYNPHPRGSCSAGEAFISGAIPCVAGSCDPIHRDAMDEALAAQRAEAGMVRKDGVYEGFSPDMPGMCPAKHSRAARAEEEALRAAAGY
jgi:hypothetical protein